MSNDLISILEKRVRSMKPHEKSDVSVMGGTLVGKMDVIKEIRKLKSITAGELAEYMAGLPEDMEVTVRREDGSRMNIYAIHDAEIGVAERDIGKV